MAKKKQKEHEVVVTYKPNKRRKDRMDPMVSWHIELDDKYVGRSTTLSGVSALLWEMGYSIWAFRRYPHKNDRPRYRATVYKHKEKK